MKWKRSRKAKEQATSLLTDTDRMHSAKSQGDSHSSSLEDEEELEGEDEDEKEERAGSSGSSGSLGVMMHAGGETGNYSSFLDEELEEEGVRTRTGVFP